MQSTLKRSAGTIAALLILFFTSCSHDDISAPNTGEVMVTFSFSLPDNASAMRALSNGADSKVGTVEVLAFDKDGKFSYASYATPEAGKNSVTVSLVKSDGADDKYDLVVLANSRLEVMSAVQQQFTKGSTTKADALAALTRTVEGKWRAMDGADKDFIPVSSDPEDTSLKGLEIKETSSFSSVSLYRALALVNVELNATAQITFQLTGVRVYNRNKQGNLIGGRNASDKYTKAPNAIGSSRTSDPILYGSDTGTQTSEITNDKSCKNEIFLFEVDQTGLTDDTRPCIVIGGLYNGSSTPTYYRADFHDGTNYLDILRNHSYTFTITGVNIHGFPTPDDAFDSREVNIGYTVDVWEDTTLGENDYIKQYSLVPSPIKFAFDAAARDENNGDNILTIQTDHPAGWTAEVESGITWLSLINFTGQAASTGTSGSSIKLKLDANATGAPRSATVKLTAGGSTYSVRVEQSEVVNRDMLYPSEADSYTLRPNGDKMFIPVSRANVSAINLDDDDVFTVEIRDEVPVDATLPIFIKNAKPVGTGSNGHVYLETGSGSGTAKVVLKNADDGDICSWNITVREPEANSYIVHPGQTIYIPVSRIKSFENALTSLSMTSNDGVSTIATNASTADGWFNDTGSFSADWLWKDNGNITLTVDPIGSGINGYVKVVVGGTSPDGNAVIGVIQDSGDNNGSLIRWSWHIWVVDPGDVPAADGTSSSTYGANTFMDRNLGATSNTNDIGAFGMHYQWGRKDPFPAPTVVNSTTESVEYNSSVLTSILSPTILIPDKNSVTKTGSPASGSTYTVSSRLNDNNNVDYSVANPHVFYIETNTSRHDWYVDSSITAASGQNNNLWGGYWAGASSKTVFDPCPPGWRVPLSNMLGTDTSGTSFSWTSLNASSPWKGMPTPSYSSTASLSNGFSAASYGGWYPAAGLRNSKGSFLNVGSNGYYWSASPSNTSNGYAGIMYFDSNNVYPADYNTRAIGYSVRCVQEN